MALAQTSMLGTVLALGAAAMVQQRVTDARSMPGKILENSLYPGSVVHVVNESAKLVHHTSSAIQAVLCVLDGKAVWESTCGSVCTCELTSLNAAYGLHTVAMYSRVDGLISVLEPAATIDIYRGPSTGNEESAARLKSARTTLEQLTPNGTGSLGVYYTTPQQEDSQIYQNITSTYGWTWTMEDVLRNSSLIFADSIWKWAASVAGESFKQIKHGMMAHTPALGIYCFYRKRSNESYGYMPDCPEASHVLQTHAAEMSAIGIDYVMPDATNWDQDPRLTGYGSDFHQLRPTEIMAEEWANMRLAGKNTPTLGTFDRVNLATVPPYAGQGGGVLWQWYLSEFFNNQTLLDLDMILMTKDTPRRKIYTIADEEPSVNYSAVRAIMYNGGAEDIVTPWMWAARDPSGNYEANGFLKYFSPCVALNASRSPHFTTDAPFVNLSVPCNHYKTVHSPIGSMWTISTGLPMSNVPFGGAKWNGLFLKKQWWDVLADPSPTDYLFMPSWNEFISFDANMSGWDMTNPYFYSLGAKSDDPDRYNLWMDGLGSERGRTIEPSLQDGGHYYTLLASCMRVYRLQGYLGVVSNGSGCDVEGEECCTVQDNERFTLVWSFDSPDRAKSTTPDAVLTSDLSEVASFTAAGWTQLCNPWDMSTGGNGGPTAVCANMSLPWQTPNADIPAQFDPAFTVVRGPFALYSNVSANITGTVGLVRCVVVPSTGATGAAYTRHYLSTQPAGCNSPNGAGVVEYILGYASATRNSLMIRDLHRCYTTVLGSRPEHAATGVATAAGAGHWYTTANGPCVQGDVDEGVLGYAF